MCKEALIIEGVLTALKGLAAIMDTTEDTGENAELGVKIDGAIRNAEYIINGETTRRYEAQIDDFALSHNWFKRE